LFPQARAQDPVKSSGSVSDMIDIESDRMDVDTQKGVAVFKGNAKATQKDIVVRGAVLTLKFDDATKKVNTLIAEKDVYIHWQDKEATCEKAVYRLDDESLDLTGNVLVTRGEERLSGQRVAVDMKTNRQSVEGQGGRVKIRVNNDQESGILQWRK
jgi:lipopolysaccharide export system protein LptA